MYYICIIYVLYNMYWICFCWLLLAFLGFFASAAIFVCAFAGFIWLFLGFLRPRRYLYVLLLVGEFPGCEFLLVVCVLLAVLVFSKVFRVVCFQVFSLCLVLCLFVFGCLCPH